MGTVVISSAYQDPFSISEMYEAERWLADDIKDGTVWDLDNSESVNIPDEVPNILVVKPEVGNFTGSEVDRMEMQIYDPNEADSSIPFAIIEKQFVTDINSKVTAHSFSEIRHVFTNTSGTKVKTVIRFREDGKLIIKYFNKKPNKNWDEDCRLVYKSEGIYFENSEHASTHDFEPAGRMLGNYKPQNIYSFAPSENYFRKVRKGTYDMSNGVSLKMREYSFADAFIVSFN
jgi:hypothetical protein